MHQNYALLIGVDDYSAHDPSGEHNLRGSRNDVRAWWGLCKELGYAPENVRVLTSPELTSKDFHGAHTGPATTEAIREGLRWLADKHGKAPEGSSLLTFSGYGDQVAGVPAICPSSTVVQGGDLAHAVTLAEIQETLASRGASRNLNAVFDCSFVGAEAAQHGRRALSLRRHASRPLAAAPAIGDRTFYAAAVGSPAYQARFPGGEHGAFTWAFMTVKDQTAVIEQNGHKVLNISNADLYGRTAAMLGALSIGQTPAVSQANLSTSGSPMFAAVHLTPPPPQVDPGQFDYRVYTLEQYVAGQWTTPGYIVAPRVTSGTWSSSNEYWCMSANIVAGSTLKFTWTDYTWSANPTPATGGVGVSFNVTQAPSWSSTTAPTSSSSLFVNNGEGTVCLSWGVTLQTGTRGTTWGGSMTWYTPTGQNTVFGGLSSNTLSLYPSYTPALTWYSTTLTA